MIVGIYRITNKIDGNSYIGSSKNIVGRISAHKTSLKHHFHYNILLQKAWDEYGENNFEFKIVYEVNDIEDLLIYEQYYIDKYNPIYNVYTSDRKSRIRKPYKQKNGMISS